MTHLAIRQLGADLCDLPDSATDPGIRGALQLTDALEVDVRAARLGDSSSTAGACLGWYIDKHEGEGVTLAVAAMRRLTEVFFGIAPTAWRTGDADYPYPPDTRPAADVRPSGSPPSATPPPSPPPMVAEDDDGEGVEAFLARYNAGSAAALVPFVPPANELEFQERYRALLIESERLMDPPPSHERLLEVANVVIGGVTLHQMVARSIRAEHAYAEHLIRTDDAGDDNIYDYLGSWPTFYDARTMWDTLQFQMGRGRFYVECCCRRCGDSFDFYFAGPCDECQGEQPVDDAPLDEDGLA